MSDRPLYEVRPDAAHDLLDWLRAQAEKFGTVEWITWDDPDMFMVHIRVDQRVLVIVYMDAARRDDGYKVVGRFVVNDSESDAPDFYAAHSVRKQHVADHPDAAAAMRAGFVKLFAALGKAPYPAA
jgi:hypothetical protein